MGATLNTVQVMEALASRYSGPEWAFFPQVRETTGAAACRTADGIALNLWPSRGHTLIGFEVKVGRSDLLKELRDPSKADAICAFCDLWYLVLGDRSILRDDELPEAWGLMKPRGRQLIVEKKAPPQLTEPLDRGFLAAVLRRAVAHTVPLNSREKRTADYDRGVAVGKAEIRRDQQRLDRERDELRARIEAFEEAAGMPLEAYRAACARQGEAVRLLMNRARLRPSRRAIQRMRDQLREITEALTAGLDNLDAGMRITGEAEGE